MSTARHVVVVGSGLAGTLTAVHLARMGHRVDVYERLPDPRVTARAGGRSINLGLSQRGIAALAEVGLLADVLRVAVPMRGRVVHQRGGRLAFQPYGTAEDQVLRSVLREDLGDVLLTEALSHPEVKIHFGTRLTALDCGDRDRRPVCRFTDDQGVELVTEADLVVGADGAFSATRAHLVRSTAADIHHKALPWGYKEFAIPAGRPGDLRCTPDALHVWPGHDGLVVAHPNINGSLTATAFLPLTGPGGLAELTTESAVRELFDTRFPGVRELVPDVVEQFLS
ncbi:NAD(P)/FAD-dependent oxidoreductase, partial [Actinosynnema sp. NPDC023658]|uniref:FAD-dependent oxidoreductase n=1 Tax=Actinosynnema sp. NPDC023658 TaxID=3155465 RepID=UPI0033F01A58